MYTFEAHMADLILANAVNVSENRVVDNSGTHESAEPQDSVPSQSFLFSNFQFQCFHLIS